MTGDRGALALAKRAFAFVEDSRAYRIGACPNIPYQIAGGHRGYGLKTLETGSNALKAALLLYGLTHERRYLAAAVREYSSARRYFADWRIPLYTAYVFDDGERCTQLPHRFFASVNGNMIWSGVTLFEVTGSRTYLAQAIATAQAVARYLQDGRGIFTDLQAENDVVEPLVEAMYELAAHHQRFAREWVLLNARAATSARTPDGAFGRFFDGPPPRSPVSIWQSTGGLALEIAAAGLEPNRAVGTRNPWSNARFISHRVTTPPSTIAFYGSGIALIGTMGEHCCEQGHARIFIDGKETFDYTGIWQNKSMTGAVPDTILFSWRWKHVGRHTIRFEPGTPNAKEGGSFLDLRGYYAI
jgi:hypothetical protein